MQTSINWLKCERFHNKLRINMKHGHTSKGISTPTYYSWRSMRRRCNNPNDIAYGRYGERGIKICDRWDSFANFLQDMGERPSKNHTIDRIDNDGNYEPDNCRWATLSQQARNRVGRRYLWSPELQNIINKYCTI